MTDSWLENYFSRKAPVNVSLLFHPKVKSLPLEKFENFEMENRQNLKRHEVELNRDCFWVDAVLLPVSKENSSRNDGSFGFKNAS